jgi:hypothetical protein
LGVGFDLERVIAKGGGQGEGPLARHQRPLIVAQNPQPIGHLTGDLRQPAPIAQALRQGFGLAQGGQHPAPVAQAPERKVQNKSQIDHLFTHGTTLGQMLQRPQRLLEGGYRLSIRRAGDRLFPSLPAIGCSLLPHLPPQGVVRHQFGLRLGGLGTVGFEHLGNVLMVLLAGAAQQGLIGRLLDQGVLEKVRGLRRHPLLIQELRFDQLV